MTHDPAAGAAPYTAVRFEVFGIVQGVGYRPFVHRLASALGLDGWAANAGGHVEGVVAGQARAVRQFTARLRTQAPPLARVHRVRVTEGGDQLPSPESGFTVRNSRPGDPGTRRPREIPPDAALCDACLRELLDPGDRRHRYPFLACADCGPRASVVEDLPYDRVRTTMRRFPLCPDCAAEYRDPGDRRFHAESLACPACGPRLCWQDPGTGREFSGEAALRAAVKAVDGVQIVAVKGLGGYQLVCDATDGTAVALLRQRKHRPTKPFAVMVQDIDAARELACVSRTERAALESAVRPVVLLNARASEVAEATHPGTGRIGLFLPTTGLHHLLLREAAGPLVVTSGNLAGGPIVTDDAEARRVLGPVADGFLLHDRPIRARYDDSVVQATGRVLRTVRRARGLAPASLPLPVPARTPVVAAGAQLKHTFALAAGRNAQLSPQGGDLADADTLDAFTRAYADLTRLTGITPAAVAHDLHPGYLSTQWAHTLSLPRVPVQHHHAHLAACAAEHGLRGPFTGVAYDGLGLGDDGTLWGGEILVADLTGYRRVGRFATAPLPGGEAAVRHPSRMALGYLCALEPLGAPRPYAWLTRPFTDRLDPRETAVVRRLAESGLNSPRASSAGRLFDAVASLLGLADTVGYEGEAAVALENAAGSLRTVPLAHRLVRASGLWVYDPAPTLTDLLKRQRAGEGVPELAAAFHLAVAGATADLVARAVADGAPRTVCLAGGCFLNRRLLTEVRRRLRAQGLRVLVAEAVPVGDGGISYGQAAVAAARLARAHS
ncbi:carbamoyltransferase HypF [Streptomyces spiroverticillatus]|uniref:Carbamoyltransferase n=1 Tax=Streptomyces finlayi TaxID=67296 RepID=A0A918WVS7_9ACTN|nr:carbamoyltransferase HypF [Streptomyces finlayi]GHA05210.1 carbamoyltransferase HypF [Streptomyces spiroverticillatus]GHC89126.1 carbamoyltransferase HypF [Streptomyces finlayi]